MLARFFTEDFRGNKVEHVTEIMGAEYAQSVMDEKDCKRFTLESEKNYYTTDGVNPDDGRKMLDKVFSGDNITLDENFIFDINAKDSE